MGQDESSVVEHEGEKFVSSWSTRWVEVGNEIAAGTCIVPIELGASSASTEFSALHLAVDDLRLSRECFVESATHGRPDSENLISKALIHAGIMSYARSFAGGVRGFRLSSEFFSTIWGNMDRELHDYLYNMRDKHVAHSVNDFERCTTVGVVVTDANLRLLDTNPSGIGVTKVSMVGLTLPILRACPDHILRMIALVEARILELGQEIHSEMRLLLEVGKQVKPAPILTFPNRANVAERRK